MALEELTREVREFTDARDWALFHTPRNLILALVGEVGALAEEVQWRSDAKLEAHGTANAIRQEVAGASSPVVNRYDD